MNDFEFNIESLGQVQPQLQRETADLGISQVANEFERQERGAERVQRQVEANQKMMIENMQTQAENAGVKYDDLKTLAKFSQTLTEKVVGYQQFKNEQKMVTGMMKAYADGYTPEEMAQLKTEEAALNEAQGEANKVAYEFEQKGGQPDVAQELRNMTGWEAYGYAKGMLQKAGANFGSFLNERANMPVMMLNGRELSLNSANTSVERDMVMTAHRETYISQFTGMNPKLLNEYLYENMKKAEAVTVKQWDADYKERIDSENEGQALDQLNSQIMADPSPQALLDSIDRNRFLFGGEYKTREEYARLIGGLIDSGKLTADQVKDLLGTAIGKNGNKITLSTWKEFDGLEQRAIDKAAERDKKKYNQIILEDKKVNLEFQQLTERDAEQLEPLTLMQRREVINQYKQGIGRPGMEDTSSMKSFMNELERDEEETVKLIKSYQEAGIPIPTELLHTKKLRDQYGPAAQNGKWATDTLQGMADSIEATLLTALELTEGKVKASSDIRYTEGIRIAKQTALSRLLTIKAENPGLKDDDARRKVLEEIQTMAGQPGKFQSSVFNYENQRNSTPKETSLNTLTNTLEWLDGEQGAGNFNVLDKQFIPGTENEYQDLVKSIESGESQIPEIYYQLAATMPGVNAGDIARAQLKVRGGPELVPTKLEDTIKTFSPQTQAILTGKGTYLTPQRVDRAIVTQQASTINTPAVQELLDYVVQDESGGNYSIIYGNRTVEGLENMTISQVIQEQHANVNRTGGGAVGKYQMIRPEEAARAVGLNLNAKFSKENQDKMAMYYMELAGYSRFMKGQISAQSFARGLASQWAALHTAEGGSYYKDGVNKAGRSTTYQGLLERIKALAAASPYNAPQNISPSLR